MVQPAHEVQKLGQSIWSDNIRRGLITSGELADDAEDIEIPEQRASFGVLRLAQANGDLEVLAGRDRRILRVQLGSDVKRGLVSLREIVERAL